MINTPPHLSSFMCSVPYFPSLLSHTIVCSVATLVDLQLKRTVQTFVTSSVRRLNRGTPTSATSQVDVKGGQSPTSDETFLN